MSREKTEEEVRNEFLNHIRHLVKYWNTIDDRPSEEKLNGLAFSILAALDGGAGGLCGFIVAPNTHEDDKQYHIDEGRNYYPENHNSDVKCDIAGSLHEFYYK
jgi:hypothetical protein